MRGAGLRIAVLVIVLVAGVVIYSFFFRATPIEAILDEPREYDGKIVLVRGTVKESVGLLSYGAYQLEDSSGKITVVTDAGIPREGARLAVRGVVKQAFAVGKHSFTVVVEKRRK